MYVTPADVREAVAPDGEFAGTCGELVDEQLGRAIQRAQDRVDAATGRAFSDANVPSLLKGTTLALAVYYGTLAYRKSKDLTQYDPVVLGYQDAMAVLNDIRTGQLQYIPTPDTVDTDPTPSRPRPTVINPTATVFTMGEFGLSTRSDNQAAQGIAIAADPESGEITYENPVTGEVWSDW